MSKSDIINLKDELTNIVLELQKYEILDNQCQVFSMKMKLLEYVENVIIKKIDEHWIIESEVLIAILDLLLYKINCHKIVYILNRYYPQELKGIMGQWLENEEYEKCAIVFNLQNKSK